MNRRDLLLRASATVVAGGSPAMVGATDTPSTFVTRAATGELRLGQAPFRYIGANMPEVTHIRTDWDLEQAQRFRLPTTDEIDWMVEAAAQANLKVIRTWCFPSHLQPELPEELRYFHRNADERTVTLNERGFVLFDYFLARCRSLGVRAQVPFVYLYAAREWADSAGDPHPQLLDFIERLVTRVNTRTGVAYRDDPTIFCWESGNEARPSARWIARLAAFTKACAPRQLFMDGRWGATDVRRSYASRPLATDRAIDLVSVHTYEERPEGQSSAEAIASLQQLMREQGRALDVGEIGPGTSVAELAEILGTVVREGVAGASWWSFKGARAKGGYTQWNGREWGGNDDLKWPGFVSPLKGVATEKAKVDLLCGAAYAIEGRQRPRLLPRPTPAKLLPIRDPGHISWIPGTGEQTAVIQRSIRGDTGFVTIEPRFETFKGSTFDLYCDATAVPGRSYFYRIGSRNSGGGAPWSNVVGPVVATQAWLVDDFWDLRKVTGPSRDVAIVSDYDLIPFHSDLSVLTATRDGAHVTYRLPGALRSALLVTNGATPTVRMEGSADGVSFQPLTNERKVFAPLHAEFRDKPRVRYTTERSATDSAIDHLRVYFAPGDALSRLEVSFASRQD